MTAYGRNPIQTPTNSMQQRQAPYQQHYQPLHTPQHHPQQPHAGPGSSSSDPEQVQDLPLITKITPAEGSQHGGTEVAIFGYNFVPGME
ncbi:SPT3 Dosage dependent suppressor of Ty-induced promoter mutations-like protein, partial [Teratosphaeriaceae sp. CCFEE 6253]